VEINFVSLADERMASFRYHNLIPAKELQKRGHNCVVSPYPIDDSDIYVFNKHFNYGDPLYVSELKNRGAKTVFHVCDDHFSTKHGEHYRKMIEICDKVLASTDIMAERIRLETSAHVSVVYDSFENKPSTPQFKPSGQIKVLWYGHPSNIGAMAKLMPLDEKFKLMICTDEKAKIPTDFDGCMFMPWSPENLINALSWCDCVVIPVKADIRRMSKSHNRMTEAILRGRFVIASEMPGYYEYKDKMYLGDVKTGLYWLADQTSEHIEKRIKEAQELAHIKYHPEVIGYMWERELLTLMVKETVQ
jgi:hypothetical protein